MRDLPEVDNTVFGQTVQYMAGLHPLTIVPATDVYGTRDGENKYRGIENKVQQNPDDRPANTAR